MTIDIFVHPDSPIYQHFPRKDIYRVFRTDLVEIAVNSDFPVLIKGNRSFGFEDLIPKERQFVSLSPKVGEITLESGNLDRDELARLESLLSDRTDGIRIHGAYFTQCVTDTATSIALLQSGHYLGGYETKKDKLVMRDEDRAAIIRHRRLVILKNLELGLDQF